MGVPAVDQIKLDEVLTALGHPIRLAIVGVLADDQQHRCGAIVAGVSKSTLTHHWRALRDAGVIDQSPSGRENLLSLRRADLEARFPGLLDSVLAALVADTETREMVGTYASDPEVAG